MADKRMTECLLCGEPVAWFSGHVHHADGTTILVGWCEEHHETKRRAQSSIMPEIAESFPSRAEKWTELTKGARPGCAGCFGSLPEGKKFEPIPAGRLA